MEIYRYNYMLQFCGNAREMTGKRVDDESLLARKLGLLAARNVFVFTPEQQLYVDNCLRNLAERVHCKVRRLSDTRITSAS